MGIGSKMREKVFFDINIVVDILDTKRENHLNVHLLLQKIVARNIQIVMSEDMLSTIFYIVRNKEAVLKFFQVIQEQWEIVPFGAEVIRESTEIALAEGIDFEDVLQCLCAKANRCEVLITHDNQFHDCGVKICTTEAYLQML